MVDGALRHGVVGGHRVNVLTSSLDRTPVPARTFLAARPNRADRGAGPVRVGFPSVPWRDHLARGDRVGRKATFLATVSLMGGATFAIGLLPTYAQAGILAPILLVFLRICQGTALGGEYGGAAIYVAEHAENGKRGAATGWIQSSASFGLLAALLVIVATRTALGESLQRLGLADPVLASILLLAIRVDALKLSESPASPAARRRRDFEGAAARGIRPPRQP